MVAAKDIDNASELDMMLTRMQELVIQCMNGIHLTWCTCNSSCFLFLFLLFDRCSSRSKWGNACRYLSKPGAIVQGHGLFIAYTRHGHRRCVFICVYLSIFSVPDSNHIQAPLSLSSQHWSTVLIHGIPDLWISYTLAPIQLVLFPSCY